MNEFTTSLATNSIKTSKRGRGKGSRGSYKQRIGTVTKRSRLSNNSLTASSSPYSPTNIPIIRQNQSVSSTFSGLPAVTTNNPKVCINPEILRRFGYSSNHDNSSKQRQ